MAARLFLLLISLTAFVCAGAQSSWQTLPDTGLANPRVIRFEDVYFTDSTTGFAVSLDDLIFKTKDAGRHWSLKNFGQPGQFRSIEFLDDKRTGLAGSLGAGPLLRTSDGGETWTDIVRNIIDNGRVVIVCGIAHRDNTFWAVGSWSSKDARLYKSTDKGLTWTVYAFDTALISGAVDAVFTSPDTGLVTGGYRSGSGNGSERSVVLKTTDGGATWRSVFSETRIGGRIWKIQAITPQLLVGSIEPYYIDTVAMIRSTDGGEHWTMLGTGFHRQSVPKLYGTQGIGFINAQHGWLGGYYNGLFETKDGGQTWDTLAFGANFNRFFVLDSNHVFAGGKDIYFYGNALPQPVGVSAPQPTILPHRLYPVSPNPAGGRVKIEFDILRRTEVLLQVAGIDARRSWELESAELPEGHYVYYWDGSDAPAGNYMVWLGTNEIPIVQQFVLRH